MRLQKIEKLTRKELISLLKLLSQEEVFPFNTASKSDLVQLLYSSLGYLFKGEPVEPEELELIYMEKVSKVLELENKPEDPEKWSREIFRKLGQKILNELRPLLEIAHVISWADGDFDKSELEVFDIIFSQLKLLKPFKTDIVNMCLRPLPAATLEADLKPVSNYPDKAEFLLAFAWAIALVDNSTHQNEIATYNKIGKILGFEPGKRNSIRKEIERRWQMLKDENIIKNSSEAVLYVCGLDKYINKVVGFDSFSIFDNQNINCNQKYEKAGEVFNSLTLFSKINLLSNPELSLLDRIVLILALILSEIH
ncbi:MAG: hypothetical protein PF689_09670 [Deltaproteobacteria bacterium]|jgi:tellurite resistance protein|nr:hypothetical protein [Deltaproteobacteria bacterium]